MNNIPPEYIKLLRWSSDDGIGYFPCDEVVKTNIYDKDYFENYCEYAKSKIAIPLTRARMALVAKHYSGPLVDVGVGSGQFVVSRPNTKGFDVNPVAIDWLQVRELWHDLETQPCEAATFWDSLEHIKHPSTLLRNVHKWVFISIPIFHNFDHILRSKHFKPEEHYHYFSHAGLATFMWDQGLRIVDHNTVETDLGRDSIMSFACKRR